MVLFGLAPLINVAGWLGGRKWLASGDGDDGDDGNHSDDSSSSSSSRDLGRIMMTINKLIKVRATAAKWPSELKVGRRLTHF